MFSVVLSDLSSRDDFQEDVQTDIATLDEARAIAIDLSWKDERRKVYYSVYQEDADPEEIECYRRGKPYRQG